jgi:predicted phosphodiesterase
VNELLKSLNTPPAENKTKTLGKLLEILERNDIDVNDIGAVQKVSLYQSLTKDQDGEAQIHDLAAIQFSPKWESGPEWPVVQRGPSVKLPPISKPTKITEGWTNAVILPDMQIGYFRGVDGTLQPTHDEKAIEVALSITRDTKPTMIVCVGDNLDFPEFGKYLTTPAYQQTTQASIDRATLLCAQMRAAAPNAEIVWLAGNHEERMPRNILTNAVAAYGLRKGNTPDSWPVLSVPYLCRMDEFGVEYRAGYPASDVWINSNLRVVHGNRVKSNGSTAHLYLAREKSSVIYGHIHRIEQAFKTREDYDGPRTIMAASPGTLARIDGAVPSTNGGVDLDGRPLRRYEDWQQGLAVINYQTDGDHRFAYHNIPIYDGWATYQGKHYTASI